MTTSVQTPFPTSPPQQGRGQGWGARGADASELPQALHWLCHSEAKPKNLALLLKKEILRCAQDDNVGKFWDTSVKKQEQVPTAPSLALPLAGEGIGYGGVGVFLGSGPC